MDTKRCKEITVFLLSLLELKGIGPRTVSNIAKKHGRSLMGEGRLDADYAKSLNDSKVNKALDNTKFYWEKLEECAYSVLEAADAIGARVLNPLSSEYPSRLLLNRNFPPILYCLGDAKALDPAKSVAMVGTRTPTDFGSRMGRRLAEILADDGYVVVSGLALGCDTEAHEGALDAGGKTIAVLPTPLGSEIYPSQNKGLAERILHSGGALVTEYPPNMEMGDRQLIANLVARDEWQPGLSDGLVAFETSVNGGTRHAVEHALNTKTPVAVFDYSTRQGIDFEADKRFGGNVAYLRSGQASPIYEPHTIDEFKKKMDEYRMSSKSISPERTSERDCGNCQTSLRF